MNYFLPAALRDALLEYMEQRERVSPHIFADAPVRANQEHVLAAQLRDLKPLREVEHG